MKKFLLRALIAVLLVGPPAYWWLFLESGTPSKPFELDIGPLRVLADSIPGEKPASIHVEHVAGFEFPHIAVVAGTGWSMTKMPVYAYQLTWNDGATALIDTGMDEKTAKSEYATFFEQSALDRVHAAMEKAKWVVVTHEHYDHLGGVSSHPKLDALAGTVVKLTKEQLSDVSKRKPLVFTESQLAKLPTLAYDRAMALAPGVVVIRTPGHTPGMQIVYVRRADDEEFLFISDVSWHQDNWQQVTERARLVTAVFLGEDRGAVLSQLAGIKALAEANPKLHVVPGHDGDVMAALVEAGLLVPKFQP